MTEEQPILPDSDGRYGLYGGRYVPETLIPALEELDKQYQLIKRDKDFQNEVPNSGRCIRI